MDTRRQVWSSQSSVLRLVQRGRTCRVSVCLRVPEIRYEPEDSSETTACDIKCASRVYLLLPGCCSLLPWTRLPLYQFPCSMFKGGSTSNVIPSIYSLGGTIRTLSAETMKRLKDRVRDVAEGVAKSHRWGETLFSPRGLHGKTRVE